jgi:hypothetical protein
LMQSPEIHELLETLKLKKNKDSKINLFIKNNIARIGFIASNFLKKDQLFDKNL